MLETAYSMVGNIPEAAIAAILAGLLRNIAGWLVNTYKDGKVDEYEIKQLFGTIVQYFSSVMLLMVGMPVEQAVAGAFVLDVGSSALKAKV
mgnify:CR=1 FL=1